MIDILDMSKKKVVLGVTLVGASMIVLNNLGFLIGMYVAGAF